MLKKLWLDEGGAIISAELVLVMVIVVIGMIVGLVALRDAVVTELADVATALGSLNMTFAIAGESLTANQWRRHRHDGVGLDLQRHPCQHVGWFAVARREPHGRSCPDRRHCPVLTTVG